MSKLVSVIIPNWNGRQYLQTCLDAVSRQTYASFEAVLVDNGSSDGSCEFVAQNYPQVRILHMDRNWGFAVGTNFGIRNTQGEYVATLNNDTEVEPTWLEKLATAMDSSQRVGMCASKMLFYDRRHVINSAGIAIDKAGIAWDRDGGKLDDCGQTQPYEILGPCAGAALYRRAMLDETGLLDEDLFAYLEDVDLAWRCQAAGWRCLYVPLARVYHVHSATGGEGSPFKNYQLGRNKWYTIIKNYPWPYWLCNAPAILGYDMMAMLWGLLSNRDVHVLTGRHATNSAQRLAQAQSTPEPVLLFGTPSVRTPEPYRVTVSSSSSLHALVREG